MALARTKKNNGKADWLESFMCGLFGIAVWSILQLFDVPEVVAVGFACGIGHFGTNWVGTKINKHISRYEGSNHEDDTRNN